MKKQLNNPYSATRTDQIVLTTWNDTQALGSWPVSVAGL
jgi:hypothetical protein